MEYPLPPKYRDGVMCSLCFRHLPPEAFARRRLPYRGENYTLDSYCKECRRNYRREYLQTPEGQAAIKRRLERRRQSRTGIEHPLTDEEWRQLLVWYQGRCAYCGEKTELTLDHIVPVSCGGKHTVTNVVPACRWCNSSKGDSLLDEWLWR